MPGTSVWPLCMTSDEADAAWPHSESAIPPRAVRDREESGPGGRGPYDGLRARRRAGEEGRGRSGSVRGSAPALFGTGGRPVRRGPALSVRPADGRSRGLPGRPPKGGPQGRARWTTQESYGHRQQREGALPPTTGNSVDTLHLGRRNAATRRSVRVPRVFPLKNHKNRPYWTGGTIFVTLLRRRNRRRMLRHAAGAVRLPRKQEAETACAIKREQRGGPDEQCGKRS